MKSYKILLIIFFSFLITIGCQRKNPSEPQPGKHTDTAKTQQALNTKNIKDESKYGIKSGIITFETDIAGTKGMKKLYFDDYGKLEREVFYDEEIPREGYVTAGGFLYRILYKQKTAYRLGPAKSGSAYRFSWNSVPDIEKKEGHAIKTENVKIAGKICESYKLDNSGIITKFAGWQGICLYAMQMSKVGNAEAKAVKIKENVPIPEEMFEIPRGFKVK